MKKIFKIFGVFALVVAIMTVGLFVAAKIIITPERVRQTVIPRAEKLLARPVSIGEIDVRLFSGISIKDFIVRTKDGKEDFISADAMVLRYRFLPLLRFQVVLDEAKLDTPRIRVVRLENGEFNFSDLLSQQAPKASTPGESAGESADESKSREETGKKSAIDLFINGFAISDGRLVFVDQAMGKNAHEYQISQLFLTASNISPDKSFPFNLEARINDAPLNVAGTLNPAENRIESQVQLDGLDAAAFQPYFADQFPGTISSLRFSTDLSLSGNANAIESKGRITADLQDMRFADTRIQNAIFVLSHDIQLDASAEKLQIRESQLRFNGIPVSATGAITSYATDPLLDLHISLPDTDIAQAVSSLPDALGQAVEQMSPAGHISADISLSGSPDHPETLVKNGRIVLEGVQVSSGGFRPSITGEVKIAGDTATGKGINIRMAESHAILDFEAINLLGTPIRITHSLSADRFDIDKILAASEGKDKAKAPTGKKAPEKKPHSKPEPEGSPKTEAPIDLPIRVEGTVSVNSAVYQGLIVNDFELLYLLENNIMNVRSIRGNVAGGYIDGRATADLNHPKVAYTADLNVEGTQTDTLISALIPRAADTLFGNLFLNMSVTGEGIDMDTIRKQLSGNADLRMTDGRLTGTGVSSGLAVFLDSKELQELTFEEVDGNVRLSEGKFQLDTRFNGKEIRMQPKGTIGLDGSLDLTLNMRLSPELSGKVNGNDILSRLLANQEGWTMIPLQLGGNLSSPAFKIDRTAVDQILRKKAGEALEKKIREQFFQRD